MSTGENRRPADDAIHEFIRHLARRDFSITTRRIRRHFLDEYLQHVQEAAGTVDVSVGEGTVMVSAPPEAPATDRVTLRKGQTVTYTANRILSAPRAIAAQQVGTWQVGILSYDQMPLEWLVADLNRQFGDSIAVPDPGLAAMPVTLTLKLHDRDTTVGTLEKLLPVRAQAGSGGAVVLVRANP